MRVLLITIDCLRADAVAKAMPNLDALGKKYIAYPRVYSNASYTTASIKSILTSTYPLTGGNYTLMNNTSVAEIFNTNGFLTAAFHSNPWFSYYPVFGKGFKDFVDVGPNSTGIPYSHGLVVWGRFEEWAMNKSSYFAWLHFMDGHDITRVKGKEDWYKSGYYKGLATVDKLIPKMDGASDVMVVTADHGDMLGENGKYGHTNPWLDEELLRVPLVIKGRGLVAQESPISLIHVSPTLLQQSGLNVPMEFIGSPLTQVVDEPVIVASRVKAVEANNPNGTEDIMRAFIWDKHKLILTTSREGEIIKIERQILQD